MHGAHWNIIILYVCSMFVCYVTNKCQINLLDTNARMVMYDIHINAVITCRHLLIESRMFYFNWIRTMDIEATGSGIYIDWREKFNFGCSPLAQSKISTANTCQTVSFLRNYRRGRLCCKYISTRQEVLIWQSWIFFQIFRSGCLQRALVLYIGSFFLSEPWASIGFSDMPKLTSF